MVLYSDQQHFQVRIKAYYTTVAEVRDVFDCQSDQLVFHNFFQVFDKNSQNESEGVGIAQT